MSSVCGWVSLTLTSHNQRRIPLPGAGLGAGAGLLGGVHVVLSFRCRRHQSAASLATCSRVPGSSKRCVAPGTISSCTGARMRRMRHDSCRSLAYRLRRHEQGRRLDPRQASSARSGRPPREITARVAAGRPAAAIRAAAAPVLAPKKASGNRRRWIAPGPSRRRRPHALRAAGC